MVKVKFEDRIETDVTYIRDIVCKEVNYGAIRLYKKKL